MTDINEENKIRQPQTPEEIQLIEEILGDPSQFNWKVECKATAETITITTSNSIPMGVYRNLIEMYGKPTKDEEEIEWKLPGPWRD